MHKKIFTLFIAFTFFYISEAQVSTQLVTITEGSAYNSSGLGVIFMGEVMTDGNLYFKGSSNGLRESIWKTDGTISGTSRILQEDNEFGGNWAQDLFIDQGILVNTDQSWGLLRPGSTTLESLGNLPSDRIESIEKVTDGSYYITVERDDNIVLYTSSEDFSMVNEIGIIHPNISSLLMTAGDAGAVIFCTNVFVDDAPYVYIKETNSTEPLEDYLGSMSLSVDISTLTYAYIHDRYMFLSYRDEDGFFQQKVIDMVAMTSHDFRYIDSPLEYYDFGDHLIMVTRGEVVSLNTTDMSNVELYSNVFGFTPIEKVEDKIYFITRENNEERLVEVDLTNGTSKSLPGAVTGNNFYNSKIKFFNEELYYIGESDYQILYKYDFQSESPVLVDTLSERNGATVVHALEAVKNELVISKRYNNVQHEMFVLGDGFISDVFDLKTEEIAVRPSIASDFIYIDDIVNEDVLIFDPNGQLVSKMAVYDGQIDVSSLVSNNYFGLIEKNNIVYQFRFVKM